MHEYGTRNSGVQGDPMAGIKEQISYNECYKLKERKGNHQDYGKSSKMEMPRLITNKHERRIRVTTSKYGVKHFCRAPQISRESYVVVNFL